MRELIEKLAHWIKICHATNTTMVHMKLEDADKILTLLKEQEERIKKFELERSEMNIRTQWESDEIGMNNNNDILSVLCGQNSAIIGAFNPETLAFRNKVIELQKNCPMVEWEQDMGKTIPCCKLDKKYCNGQCTFKTNDCPCNA